jgi:hypothetical protein
MQSESQSFIKTLAMKGNLLGIGRRLLPFSYFPSGHNTKMGSSSIATTTTNQKNEYM